MSLSTEKSCRTCGFYAELKEPYKRSDGVSIFGYCFKSRNEDYSLQMGKGYPVFTDGAKCKDYKNRRANND